MADPHEEKAEELEREADFLEKGSKRVDSMIKETREEWEQKKSGNAAGAADPGDAAPGGLGEDDDS